MKITKISAYQVDLPLQEGRYNWSDDNAVETSSTRPSSPWRPTPASPAMARCCPLGPAYLPAYAAGVRAGLKEIGAEAASASIPRDLGVLNRRMDEAMRGHPYVKSPHRRRLLGHPGQGREACPSYALLGGAQQAEVKLYRAISQDTPDKMAASVGRYRAEGYTKFQLKVGGDADTDIERIQRLPRGAEIRRRADRRRQYRLADA